MILRLLRSLLIALVAAGIASGASAAEEILDYDARIDIARDGTLNVTETITVSAEGKKIKRGIYRDFPTRYTGRYGTRVEVPFEVVRVMRDGSHEEFHTKNVEGGVRVYIGKRNQPVSHGVHRYELSYRTRRQLGFFEQHDELYWNVTGNFWDFQILQAAATVRLPETVDPTAIVPEGYTGPAGAKGHDWTSYVDPDSGELRFETTKALPRHHGLSIVVQFPKGIVTPPSEAERRQAFREANASLLIGLIGIAVVLAYYGIAWLAVGRDPASGTIIPRFEPPRGQSPAAMRHLTRMGYDNECFSAALVSMAVKDYLRIEEEDGEYTLVRAEADRKVLSSGERRIADRLIPKGRFVIRQSDHAKIRSAIAVFRKWLKLENEGGLFRANRGVVIPGVVISLLAIIATANAMKDEVVTGVDGMPVFMLIIWLTIWSCAVYSLLVKVVNAWKTALGSQPGAERVTGSLGAAFLTCFATPFVIAEFVVLGILAKTTSIAMIPTLLVLVLSNLVFYQLLKQPTRAGRRLMDEIEGFEMYLRTAEGDHIRRLEGPKPTPELFERLLPYALALGVENEWAERFSDVLEQAGQVDEHGYSPNWYSGRDLRLIGSHGLVSSLGSSLSGAVASNSAAPGSSSGGGGGGSSGGGGGGGGGGGW
ncbi:MAG: DUF2207 domain-containing protein [Deltaproteobacteria bacterium]|nr:DUF2207 domain-containing protein [Deltaproteobacteria bacterium]